MAEADGVSVSDLMRLIRSHAGCTQLCCCYACQASARTPGFGLVQFPDGDIYDVTCTKYFIVYTGGGEYR